MGCLIQIVILGVCAGAGFSVFGTVGAVVGLIVGFYLIAKLNSH